MRAARLHAAGDIRLHDEPDPEPAAGEEIVRITAVGLCGSDRHWFEEGGIGDAVLARPLVLGHEIAGLIETGPRSGERVAVDPADPCRRCEVCLAGHANLCPNLRFAGHGPTDGGLRTLMAWPGHLLAPLPDTIADAEAPLLEPLGVALHALDRGGVRPGMAAGVFGCGPIGLLLVQLLRMVGCGPIIATDRLAHRADAATAMGASEVRLGGRGSGGRPSASVDVAFEVAGDDEAVADAVHAARPGGRVVLVGIPADDRTTFPASVARRKGLSLVLSRRMTAADLPPAIRLVAEGRIRLADLVTGRYPLSETVAAFGDLVERRGSKTIVEVGA